MTQGQSVALVSKPHWAPTGIQPDASEEEHQVLRITPREPSGCSTRNSTASARPLSFNSSAFGRSASRTTGSKKLDVPRDPENAHSSPGTAEQPLFRASRWRDRGISGTCHGFVPCFSRGAWRVTRPLSGSGSASSCTPPASGRSRSRCVVGPGIELAGSPSASSTRTGAPPRPAQVRGPRIHQATRRVASLCHASLQPAHQSRRTNTRYPIAGGCVGLFRDPPC